MPFRFYHHVLIILASLTSPPCRLLEPSTLAWKGSPSTEVVGYKIFWGTGSYNYQNVRDVKNALTASLALPKNNEYYVAVTAYSMTTSSWFSNEVIVPASSGP